MFDFKNGSFFKLSKTNFDAAKDIYPILIQGEQIIGVYKAIRDYVVFTTKRMITVNVQGMTGKIRISQHFPILK